MLSVKNITKVYKSQSGAEVKALRGVNVDFGNNGLVFLLGKSGSGKSTLLNILGGTDSATSGEVIFRGRSSADFKEEDFDSYRNTYVGYVFQEYNLTDEYNVGANVSIALELQGEQADREKVDEILRKVDLVDPDSGDTLFLRAINELSGGQKQRVAIARAIIKNPQIILADEPTGALDSATSEQLYALLKSLAHDKLVIVVTHDNESAQKYGDRILEIKDGLIISDTDSNKRVEAKAEAEQKSMAQADLDYRVIKSKLPFKRSLAMGANSLKRRKFRLVVSVMLSVITFVIFGFSITASLADEYTAELKTLYENNIGVTGISGRAVYDKGGAYESMSEDLTKLQYDKIEEYNGKPPMLVFTSYEERWQDNLDISESNASDLRNTNPYFKLGLVYPFHTLDVNPQTGEEDAMIRKDLRFKDSRLCRLPQTETEVAITDLRADMFMRFNHRAKDGTVTKITCPDDLIGKEIGKYIICGVYSTTQDKKYFEQFDIDGYDKDQNPYLTKYLAASEDSIISFNFILERPRNLFSALGYKDSVIPRRVYVKLSGNIAKERALIKSLSYKTEKYDYSVRLVSPYSSMVADAMLYKHYMMIPAMIAVCLFGFFSALLTMNFLSVSLEFKKKELSILRALGARRKDIHGILLIESMLIAMIEFAVSLLLVIIACSILNKLYFVSLFNVGFVALGAMALLCFGVSAVATILPAARLTSKKPIEAINGK